MLETNVFSIDTSENFERTALEVFRFQYEMNVVYGDFCRHLKIFPSEVKKVEDIPFLPISFFKTHSLLSKGFKPDTIFSSSGTTGSITSKHFVANLNLYIQSFQKSFNLFYGDLKNMAILALLPSYLEREDSSLIYMVQNLIEKSGNENSGFYLNDTSSLIEKINLLEKSNQKTMLIGVSFALLDLIESHSFQLKNTIVMETGGMKGRRKELVREELHSILKKGFGVSKIHSEYGMTELLSQAYSQGNGIFKCPPWMHINTRDTEDALTLIAGETGGINVIDLANIYSCSFIATQDLGKVYPDGSFEILGRFDSSDIRGCNLMVS